jgi:nucleotide-binding universal stress UspA family protein
MIERVVVPLDAAAENQAAIETAARLAARAGAALRGIFIEDEELLFVAALPFTRQVAAGTGARPFTVEDTELQLRAAAERARGELIATAQRYRVEASFEVVRGGTGAALSGISERDLVVAGALGRPVTAHFRVECRWWSSIEVTPGPFLLARHGSYSGGGVVVLLRDRGPGSARLLTTAAQIAEAGDGELIVICPPPIADAADLRDWLAERLAGFRVRLRVEAAPDRSDLPHHLARDLAGRLLAVEAGSVEGGTARLRDFVERFSWDVLIVR